MWQSADVCVCVCVCAGVRAGVRACVCGPSCAHDCVFQEGGNLQQTQLLNQLVTFMKIYLVVHCLRGVLCACHAL